MTLGIMLEGVTLAIRAIEIKIPAFAGMTGGAGGDVGALGFRRGGGGVGPRLRGGFGWGAGDSEVGGYGVGCTVAALDSSLRSE